MSAKKQSIAICTAVCTQGSCGTSAL